MVYMYRTVKVQMLTLKKKASSVRGFGVFTNMKYLEAWNWMLGLFLSPWQDKTNTQENQKEQGKKAVSEKVGRYSLYVLLNLF